MGKFIKVLDENYKFWKESEFGVPPESKMEYIGHVIFNFTTYSNSIDELFAALMMPVIRCILEKKTFEYQEDRSQYINYLHMVNMPFLVNKLEWGTSIRGAWFDDYQEYEIDCGRIIIEKQELSIFIADLIEWSEFYKSNKEE